MTPLELGRAAAEYVAAPYLLSGLLVLQLLDLRWLPHLDQVQVLVPDRVRRPSSYRVRVTRTGSWAQIPRWSRGGLCLASAERAVVDAARAAATLREARGIVLGAVADRHATVEELRAIVEAGQRNGSALVRRPVLDAERGCASPPEAELVDALIGRGQPFLVNPEVWVDGMLLGCPDIWLVGTAVGGEVESAERHGDEIGLTATYDRHERFAAAGAELVHLSVPRIRRSANEAADALLARGRASRAVPSGLLVVPRGPLLQ
jgi:hypothetical protein